MASESDKPSKQIIIDEDWKSRVEAEREAARGAQESSSAGAASASGAGDDAEPMPPPDLSGVVTIFFVQALVGLGITPNPLTGKNEPDLARARHAIDVIEMLQRKTEGNRTAEESVLLDDVLHKLRLAYVAATEGSGASGGKRA